MNDLFVGHLIRAGPRIVTFEYLCVPKELRLLLNY
jgi:hypothetical protein